MEAAATAEARLVAAEKDAADKARKAETAAAGQVTAALKRAEAAEKAATEARAEAARLADGAAAPPCEAGFPASAWAWPAGELGPGCCGGFEVCCACRAAACEGGPA